MTRKKVKLAFISNDSSRKATFKKRKKGLTKKVNELSTLCGIHACAIIYSPYDSTPEVWPSPSGVQRVISEFRALPEMDQQKKMVDQETYLRQRIAKASDHFKRQKKDNRELEMIEVMFQCLVGKMGTSSLNIVDLNDLGYLIDRYLKDVNRRIDILGNSGMEIGESSNAADVVPRSFGPMVASTAITAPNTTIIEAGSSSSSLAAAAFLIPVQHHQHQYQQHMHQQQQFFHPVAPYVEVYEQSRNLNDNHNQNQRKWFMETMNHPQQMNYAEQISFPFMDGNHHIRNHHHHQQHQHTLGESSTALTTVTPTTTIPVTSSNLTNNIWFR